MIIIILLKIIVIFTSVISFAESPKDDFITSDSTFSWEKMIFESLGERLKKDNLDTLRTKTLAEKDLEIRFWILYDNNKECYILKRNDSKWSGIYIKPYSYFLSPLGDIINVLMIVFIDKEFKKVYGIKNITPKSDWNSLWKKLEELNIMTLPDESELKLEFGTRDGYAIIVEVANYKNYRMYHYINPILYKNPETRAINEIHNLLYDEFK